MKFRKRPISIDAISASEVIRLTSMCWKSLPEWIRESYEKGNLVIANDHIVVITADGNLIAKPEDMIIQGIKGDLYPCRGDIFDATYEQLAES